MTYAQAIAIGVDLIFPAVLLFSILYSLLPFWQSTLGWAMFLHGWSTTLLLAPTLLEQIGLIGERYPAEEFMSLLVITLWIGAWWLLAWALLKPRLKEHWARLEGSGVR